LANVAHNPLARMVGGRRTRSDAELTGSDRPCPRRQPGSGRQPLDRRGARRSDCNPRLRQSPGDPPGRPRGWGAGGGAHPAGPRSRRWRCGEGAGHTPSGKPWSEP